MKKKLLKSFISLAVITSITPIFSFSSCSNPNPIKPPRLDVKNGDKTTFLYQEKTSYSFDINLDNFVGNEVIYFSIVNQKKDDVVGEYVQFDGSEENPFVIIKNIQKSQTIEKLTIELIDPLENEFIESKITFDLNLVVLRSGKNILNTNINDFSVILAHPTPANVFLTDSWGQGEIDLLGFDFENHQEEILKCSLLLIPSNITSIVDNAFFKDNQSTIPENIKWIDFESNIKDFPILFNIGDNAFKNAQFENSIVFPDSIENIGVSAFEYCNSLHGILVLPKWLKTIGHFAFNGCNNITSINFNGNMVTSIGDYAFNDCLKLEEINFLPQNLLSIGAKAFANCEKLKTILTIPQRTTIIDDYAFYNCKELTSIAFETLDFASLTTIGAHAFENSSLSGELVLPKSVETIKDYAFYSCKIGISFTFPENLSFIGDFAFSNCNFNLKLIFNNKIRHIGKNAFVNNNIHMIDLLKQPAQQSALPEWIAGAKTDIFAGCSPLGWMTASNWWYDTMLARFPSLADWARLAS